MLEAAGTTSYTAVKVGGRPYLYGEGRLLHRHYFHFDKEDIAHDRISVFRWWDEGKMRIDRPDESHFTLPISGSEPALLP